MATNVDHCFGTKDNQFNVTVESVQPKSLSILTPILFQATRTALKSLAPTTAAQSSNLGRLTAFVGATRVLAVRRAIVTCPSISTTRE